jgi:hypothetical protein
MKKVILFILGIIVLCPISGQNQPVQGGQQRWGQQRQTWQRNAAPQQAMPNHSGQFSAAEYWKQQKAFFTEKAGLTEDESEKFFPLYNELQQKKRELNREVRRMSYQDNQSEDQARKTLDVIAETNLKIAQLEKEYLEKFKEVLPASKILKVQNAEDQFNSQILKDIQQSRGHQFQQGPQQRPQQPQFNPSRQSR